MPNPTFLVFELGIYTLALCCLRHAWLDGWPHVFGLLAGMGYGVLLEYAAIETFHVYRYGHFVLMIGGIVPLCIGLSWGLIIYTSMRTSDRFGLPWYLRPLVDATLALTIDLSMDAIAIRLGFWTWDVTGLWFGVPLANFYAWFVVVAGFSLLVRIGQRSALAGRRAFLADVLAISVALPLSVLGLVPLVQPYIPLVSQGNIAWLSLGLLCGSSALLSIGVGFRTQHTYPPDFTLLSVPICFHGFFFSALFWTGIGQHVPALISVAGLVLLVSILIHVGPSWVQLTSLWMPRRRS